jgi:hypothetical protein
MILQKKELYNYIIENFSSREKWKEAVVAYVRQCSGIHV